MPSKIPADLISISKRKKLTIQIYQDLLAKQLVCVMKHIGCTREIYVYCHNLGAVINKVTIEISSIFLSVLIKIFLIKHLMIYEQLNLGPQ